jgi:hypothetical protein
VTQPKKKKNDYNAIDRIKRLDACYHFLARIPEHTGKRNYATDIPLQQYRIPFESFEKIKKRSAIIS